MYTGKAEYWYTICSDLTLPPWRWNDRYTRPLAIMYSAIFPQFKTQGPPICAKCMTNNINARLRNLIYRHRRFFYVYFGVLCIAAIALFIFSRGRELDRHSKATLTFLENFSPEFLHRREWGFEERPTTEQCYAQERTAMLLALFLGSLGVDQFYAHHWTLAVFKLLTGGCLGLWSLIDLVLWIVGGIYGTPGCPGGKFPRLGILGAALYPGSKSSYDSYYRCREHRMAVSSNLAMQYPEFEWPQKTDVCARP